MLPLVAKGRSIGLVELMSRTDVVGIDQPGARAGQDDGQRGGDGPRERPSLQEARELADRDQLTGFFNHRYLHERLGEEIVRARRFEAAALALLMIDLDDFKLVNDTFGHLFGDRVLA